MDPVTLSVSVAGLLSLAIQLTQVTQKFVSQVSHAAKESKELLDELKTLGQTLGQLEKFLNDENAKNNSFEKTSVLWGAMRDCENRLKVFEDKLNKALGGGRTSVILHNLKWPFSSKEQLDILLWLRRCREIFQFSLTLEGWYAPLPLVLSVVLH
jgi:hypothetical protein